MYLSCVLSTAVSRDPSTCIARAFTKQRIARTCDKVSESICFSYTRVKATLVFVCLSGKTALREKEISRFAYYVNSV
jgi:hypothetical protein